LRSLLEAANEKRDLALRSFPEGVAAALAAAQSELTSANAEVQAATAELASLDKTMALRKARIEEAVADARSTAVQAQAALESAQASLTEAMTTRAAHLGRLAELKRLRDAEDLGAAETKLREATERYSALPVPERNVTRDEVIAAKNAEGVVRLELESIDREIHRAHGALEQVGGAVARERLRDAAEAFELAQQEEKEIEAEYEAWKLLLDQMKEADAAQASNLGQAIAPAIASRFQALTDRRYETVRLSAALGTEGIVVGGTVRSSERMSVGTREQLSTLYRLSLAEYLQTVLVLDDQLVQSDETRMDWFRELLKEKSRTFQIVVFTCRPRDYLGKTAMVPKGKGLFADTDEGFTRAFDLGRALRQEQESAKPRP
jgi:DNA repair exonuclease SbcCD ATPase subunit